MSEQSMSPETTEAQESQEALNLNSQIWKTFGKSLIIPLLLAIFYGAAPYWLNHNLGVKAGVYYDYASLTWGAGDGDGLSEIRTAMKDSGVLFEFQCLSVCFYISCGLVALLVFGQLAVYLLNHLAKNSDDALVRNFKLAWGLTIFMGLVNVLLQIPLMGYGCYEITVLTFHVYFPKIIAFIVIGGIVVLWQSITLLFTRIPLEFQEPMSRELTPEDAPELWEAVRAAAEKLHTAPPDKIIAGVQFNFYVTELDVIHDKGRAAGRTLYVSYPLLRQLSQKELLAIIGHEMGHFQGNDTVLTNHFYPLKRKVLGTLITMAEGGLMAWPSLQAVSFFFFCFEGTASTRSRIREFHADSLGASLTSPRVAAQALVKVHVFMEAFHRAMQVYMKNPVSNPLEIDLRADVRSNYMSDNTFWENLFEQKMPHPMDSHPPLKDRLEALGESPTSRDAQLMFMDEDPQDVVPIRQDAAVFAELAQEATAQVEKIRNISVIKEAVYETPEGKQLLDAHFPPREWTGKRITHIVGITIFTIALGSSLSGLILTGDSAIRAIWTVTSAVSLAILAWLGWSAYISTGRKMILTAGGITYSGWVNPLEFKNVSSMSVEKDSGRLFLIFNTKDYKTLKLKVYFNEGKPEVLAQMVYDYYQRQER